MTAARPYVLLVITKGEIGGAQSHVIELCRALRGRVRIGAVIGGDSGSFLEQALRGLNVVTLCLPELRNSLNPLRLIAAVRALREITCRESPNILHAHSTVAGAVARVVGRASGVPVIYTVHGFGFKPQVPVLNRAGAWLAETLLARWTSRLICVSEHERRLAVQLPIQANRTKVILNAIHEVAWRSDQAALLPSVVMVARMAKPKRQDLLLGALSLLASEGLHPVTHLLGDGPLREEHEALATKLGLTHVRFLGDVLDLPEQLAKHQIFVLLSDHEGLPISVLEAMRAGMAIVATRLPGVEELLVHEVSALLVGNNPREASVAISRLLRETSLRQRLAIGARARYEARHRPKAMGDELQDLYMSVLQE